MSAKAIADHPASPVSLPSARWSAALLGLVVVAILGIAYLAFDRQKRDIEAHAERNLANIAALKASQINLWLKERRGDGAAFGGRTPFARMVDAWVRRGAPDDEDRRRMLSRLDAIRGSYDYEALLLFDPQGRIRLSTGESASVDARERQLALDAARTRRVRMGDVHADAAGRPVMGMAAPLLVGADAADRAVGILYFRLDPAHFLFPLIESWPVESRTAETLLVRRDGENVQFISRLRHKDVAPLSLLAASDLPAAQVLRGKTGHTHGIDYRGQAVVGYLQRIPDTGWGMVAKIDEAEIYAPIRRLGFEVGAALFILLSFLIYVFWSLRARAAHVYREYRNELRSRILAQRFDDLSKAANDIILLADDRGRLCEVNDRALESYGYTRAEMLQMSIRELRTPQARGRMEHDWGDLKTQGSAIFETMHQRRDGSSFPVEASVRLIDAGNERYLQEIVRDISARKRTEAVLRLHEQMTSNMQEGLTLVTDGAGIIAFANPRAEAMFGYAPGELAGRHVSCINAPTAESPQETAAAIMATLRRCGAWSGEIRNVRKDGTAFWCKAAVSGFEHPDHGRVWLSIHTDITDLKNLERAQGEHLQRIRELGQHLVAVQESERRRLGAELHDRTAANLAAMKLLLKDLAHRHKFDGGTFADRMEDIQALMADTTNTVSEIAGDLRPPLLDFLGLAPALESLAGKFAKRTGIAARVHAAQLPQLDKHVETVLYRIVQEALANCAKHAGAANVAIDLVDSGDRVMLTVADDGVGFAAPAAGTASGVGMLTMRERAEFAGGSFSLDTARGEGTRIRVDIPCVRAVAAQLAHEGAARLLH